MVSITIYLATEPADDSLEGLSELPGEKSIYDRVYGRVAVAKPEEHREQKVRHTVYTHRPTEKICEDIVVMNM